MGCCSSKSRAERHTLDNLDSSISSAAAVAEKLQCAADVAVLLDATPSCSPCSSPQSSSLALLTDSVNGVLLPKSDDNPAPSSPESATVATQLQENRFNGVDERRDDPKTTGTVDFTHESAIVRPAEVTSTATLPSPSPSPVQSPLQASPRKAPVNYEEVPINSMYHRIHAVEAEAQVERRRQELREEAERHEREMSEFKASMLQS